MHRDAQPACGFFRETMSVPEMAIHNTNGRYSSNKALKKTE
jgi:hypothetical protein